MSRKNKGLISKFLNWGYSKAISGLGGADSAYQLGNDYLKTNGNLEQQVDKLITWQVTKSATNGFLTGLGGFALIPLTLPANVIGVMYIQMRMIAAIAYMGGYDIKSDQVRSLIYICMVGNGAKEILKDIGVKAGEKFAAQAVKDISAKALNSLSEKATTSFASKLGGKAVSKFSKTIPLAGGVISSAFDATSTKIVGEVAKKIFITNIARRNESEVEIIEEL